MQTTLSVPTTASPRCTLTAFGRPHDRGAKSLFTSPRFTEKPNHVMQRTNMNVDKPITGSSVLNSIPDGTGASAGWTSRDDIFLYRSIMKLLIEWRLDLDGRYLSDKDVGSFPQIIFRFFSSFVSQYFNLPASLSQAVQYIAS